MVNRKQNKIAVVNWVFNSQKQYQQRIPDGVISCIEQADVVAISLKLSPLPGSLVYKEEGLFAGRTCHFYFFIIIIIFDVNYQAQQYLRPCLAA